MPTSITREQRFHEPTNTVGHIPLAALTGCSQNGLPRARRGWVPLLLHYLAPRSVSSTYSFTSVLQAREGIFFPFHKDEKEVHHLRENHTSNLVTKPSDSCAFPNSGLHHQKRNLSLETELDSGWGNHTTTLTPPPPPPDTSPTDVST